MRALANDWSAMRVVVMGLGRFGGGAGAAAYLARRGARVVATDLRTREALPEASAALAGLDVEWVLGGHREADFERAGLVVANPAVRPDHPLLERARASGARITTEIELFLAELPCTAAAITGTQGKSSTTAFTAQLLAAAGRRVHTGGNIGGSLLDTLDDIEEGDCVVLELSSYQLEHLASPPVAGRCLRAAAVVNVLEDHLERHGTRAAYAAAKGRIFELLADDGLALVPAGEAAVATWPVPGGAHRIELSRADAREGSARAGVARDRDGGVHLRVEGEDFGPFGALGLPPFQAANVAAALAIARFLGASSARLRAALTALRPPEHRLEDLGLRAGVRVLDNGVSTTPDSTLSALEAVEGPVVLLVGGAAKRLDYAPLAAEAARRGCRVVLFGAAAEGLAPLFSTAGAAVRTVPGVAEAAREGLSWAPSGGTVLFSPACASFDAHPNFRERAACFRAALAPADATGAPPPGRPATPRRL